jgi:hypothetical protein
MELAPGVTDLRCRSGTGNRPHPKVFAYVLLGHVELPISAVSFTCPAFRTDFAATSKVWSQDLAFEGDLVFTIAFTCANGSAGPIPPLPGPEPLDSYTSF